MRYARGKGSKSSNEKQPEEPTSWKEMKQQLQEKQKSGSKEDPYKVITKSSCVSTESFTSTWTLFEEPKKKIKIKKDKKFVPVEEEKSTSSSIQIDNDAALVEKFKYKKRDRETQDFLQHDIDNQKVKKKSKNNFFNLGDVNTQSQNLKRKGGEKQSHQPYKQRTPDTEPIKMYINGKEIEVVKFDGFRVKIEDADRLGKLKEKLLASGISKAEVQTTMKLERRKAEKALARERKNVCYLCRVSDHVLSECPKLEKSNDGGTGICFKCGSTEHTHFKCKVVRGQDFRFAKCFICMEQGHIARQCPDNPRGLYPKGGACKVCGDITHLKKDCPDLIAKREDETITLKTLGAGSLEVLDEDIKNIKREPQQKKIVKKRHIKF